VPLGGLQGCRYNTVAATAGGGSRLHRRLCAPCCSRLPAASALSCRNVPPRKGAGSRLEAPQHASPPESARVQPTLGAGEKLRPLRAQACDPNAA